MGKGSKVITFRLPDALLQRIRVEMDYQRQKGETSYISVGNWIRTAMEQRLDHLERTRTRRKMRPKCEKCGTPVDPENAVKYTDPVEGKTVYFCSKCQVAA